MSEILQKQVYRFKFYADTIEQLGVWKGLSFLFNKKLKKNKLIHPEGIDFPISLRPDTSDEQVFMKIFIGKDYEFDLDFEPQYIIDGGANIGLASIYFAAKYKNAKIIAIEPDDENFAALKTNTKLYSNIVPKKVGLWSENKTSSLSDKYELGKWAMVVDDDVNKQDGKIALNTITDVMEEFQLPYIDVLKLDIESAEKQVFGDNYMQWLPKVKVITIELHDWMTSGCSKAFFTAINNAFTDYTYAAKGENVIITNTGFLE